MTVKYFKEDASGRPGSWLQKLAPGVEKAPPPVHSIRANDMMTKMFPSLARKANFNK